jgi:hypothetical protein
MEKHDWLSHTEGRLDRLDRAVCRLSSTMTDRAWRLVTLALAGALLVNAAPQLPPPAAAPLSIATSTATATATAQITDSSMRANHLCVSTPIVVALGATDALPSTISTLSADRTPCASGFTAAPSLRWINVMPWERGHSTDVGKPMTPRNSAPTRPRPAPEMSPP